MIYTYLLIIFYILVFIVKNLIDEKDFFKQLNAALVLIPLILRLVMIK